MIAKQNRQRELVFSTEAGFDAFDRAATPSLPLRAIFPRDAETMYVWWLHDMIVRCSYKGLKQALEKPRKKRVRLRPRL